MSDTRTGPAQSMGSRLVLGSRKPRQLVDPAHACLPCGSGTSAARRRSRHRHSRPPPRASGCRRYRASKPVADANAIAAITPEWLMANTMSRSITGRPAMSSSSRQGGDLAGMGQHVVPGLLAVLDAQREEFAGGIGRDHELARHRGAGGRQDARRFRHALLVPQSAAIGFGEGIEMIVMGGKEDAPAIDHRCIDDRHFRSWRQISRPLAASMQSSTPKPEVTNSLPAS